MLVLHNYIGDWHTFVSLSFLKLKMGIIVIFTSTNYASEINLIGNFFCINFLGQQSSTLPEILQIFYEFQRPLEIFLFKIFRQCFKIHWKLKQ